MYYIHGYLALYTNTTGGYNAANGYQALFNNTTGSGNTANGTVPLYNNTTGSNNTANGYQALNANTTGNYNTADGYSALSSVTTGTNNTGLGYNAQVPTATANDQVRIGNTSVTYAGVQVAWTITSDQRWKTQTRNLPYGLNLIAKLKPVDYLRVNAEDKNREMGFIAQDVEKALQEVGYNNQGFLTKTDAGFYELRYNDFIALLVKGMQEQQTLLEQQQKRIEALEQAIKTIKK